MNRNKLIDLFVGNIANAIIHNILESAIDDQLTKDYYDKEISLSFNIAIKYREKINPKKTTFPDKDIPLIKDKILKKVNGELLLRISKGYGNIDLKLVEPLIDEYLIKVNVI